jgi:hypothetical protein
MTAKCGQHHLLSSSRGKCAPSKGFIRASLAIVAHAPLAAVVSVSASAQLQQGLHLESFHTSCERMMFAICFVSASRFFYELISAKVYSMSRTCNKVLELSSYSRLLKLANTPAPTMTLVTPRHNVRSPSIRYIVETAWDKPVYRPPAAGFMICIRVCGRKPG